MNNINDIKKNHLCYGCGTCNVACSKNAITMQYDNIGRILPYIDKNKCIDCGICYNICPSLDYKGIQITDIEDCYIGNVKKTYIGKSNNFSIYRNAQSGGLVTTVLKFLFDSGKIDAAIVCKVIDEIEYTPKATIITSVEELSDCQKSSYVPIDMVSAIKNVKQYKSIAVVGTGCHIQGFFALKKWKQIYRDKIIYLLGLICDRTLCKTSTDVLYGNRFSKNKKKIIWRDKSTGYKKARLLIKTNDGKQKEIPRWQRFAIKDPFTNPRCRICFDKLNIHADIVFGDPWGMNNVDWERGMSVMLIRTEIGEKIINKMIKSDLVSLNTADLSEVIAGQRIEKRRMDVSMGLGFYKDKGWLMPVYVEKYLEIRNACQEISIKIESFVNDLKLSKGEIINKYINLIRIETHNKNIVVKLFKKIAKLPFRLIKLLR